MAPSSDGQALRAGAASDAEAAAAAGAVSFDYLAEIAVGTTTRIDLCRIIEGPRAGQLCAVKRLHPHLAEDPLVSTQFFDEVWMTAALRHPNVVEVAGWGEDGQGTYLAVELVQGVSLARLMKTVFETGEEFSERMIVFVAACLCRGLAAAHALRGTDGELLHLVHRDLAPGNVLTSFDGAVKIADFGIAKAKQRLTKTLTGLLKGQPAYMSPEYARGKEVDARSDLFSLGVMLFELFSGQRPWSPPNEIDVVQTMLTQPSADLRELRPKIDRELVAIVSKCLERDPAARFQSADDVLLRLTTWLNVHGYDEGNEAALARFVRRNAMRQMRWFERALAGELAPSIRGSSVPAPPLPPPTNTSTSNQPLQRLPVSPGAASVSALDEAEATDVDPKPSLLQRQRVVPSARAPGPENLDWGEEQPTLVQSQSAASRRSAFRVPRAVVVDIVEEDSDGRTTAVKRPSGSGPARVGRAAASASQGVIDGDSEDAPTLPLDARLRKLLSVSSAQAGLASKAKSDSVQSVRAVDAELTTEILQAEAARLAEHAAQLEQEAHDAANAAAHAEAVARMASEAAAMAADASRLASTIGLSNAGARLEQALALEDAARRGDVRIVQVVPPDRSRASRLPALTDPLGPSPAPPVVARLGVPPAPPPPAPPASVAPSSHRSPTGAPAALDPGKFGTFEALAFEAQLKPTLWGMPRPLALAFATGIVLLGVLVLWLLLT